MPKRVLLNSIAVSYGVFIPGPGTTGYTAHNIPGQGTADDFIHSVAAIQYQTKAAVDALPIPVPPPLCRATRLMPLAALPA